MSEEEIKTEAEVVTPEAPKEPERFIGSSKVIKDESRENGFIHYETEDGRSGLVKPDQFNNMVRKVAYDDQLVMVYKWQPVTAKVLQIMLDYDVPMADYNFIVKQISQSIVENYEKATSKLYKRQLTDHVRFSQIDEVLKTTTELIVE